MSIIRIANTMSWNTMSIYYEINQRLTNGFAFTESRYWVQHNVSDDNPHNKLALNKLALVYADRIWEESNTGIRFIKNRFTDIHTLNKDELKEFMWIKLKSKEI